MSLDRDCFVPVGPNSGKHQAYRCRYSSSTMVYFSAVSETPVAAFVLVPDFQKQALLTARDQPGHFQGLLKEDGAEFQLCVSNLSDHWLSFHVFEDGDERPVNKVNAVKAKSSYLIPCDNRTNRRMKIQAKKKADGSGEHVTVEEAEAKGGPGSLKFLVKICSEKGNKLFQEGEGVWKCVPGLVIPERDLYREERLEKGMASSLLLMDRGGVVEQSMDRGARRLGGYRSGDRGLSRSSNHVMPTSIPKRKKKSQPVLEGFNPEEDVLLDMVSGGVAEQSSAVSMPASMNYRSLDIGKTTAVNLAYGEKEIEVKSQNLDLDLDLDHTTSFSVSMSLWEKMELLELGDDFLEDLRQQAKDAANKQLKEQVKQVFKSETCCIDLESPVDVVVVGCGHACVNHNNTKGLTKCPMCRGHIIAFLPLEVM